ncbi:MAG: hypothetical protein QM582_01185 [Micropruina sp.]|uniref:hypothetical protein n=1 Tax=Micropruina sp. TaxID=2737536 RepID=UPI0039E458BD
MRRLTHVLVAGGAVAALALAGCAAPDPKQAVDQAVEAFGSQQAATMTVKLDTTTDDLAKISKAAGQDASNPTQSAQAAAVLKLIPQLSFTMASRAQQGSLKQADNSDKIDFSARIAVGDKPIELVKVNNKGYVRADVDGLGQQSGLFTGTQVRMMLSSFAGEMPWLNELVDGKWLQIDEASMKQFIENLAKQTASASPQAVEPSRYLAVLTTNSTVARVNDTTYTVVTDAKGLIKGLADIDPNDELTTEKADQAIAELQDGANLDTTLTIESGKLTKVSVDLADIIRTWFKPAEGSKGDMLRRLQAEQFTLKGVAELSDKAEITEPAGATTIPAKDLERLLGGAAGPR